MKKQNKQNKSNMWIQKLEDIRKNPYENESHKLFFKEASSVLDIAFNHYDKYQMKFHMDDRSVEKAIWMLHLDALDTLRDCVLLLEQKKHRIVGKLFRDVLEVLDLSALFWGERNESSNNLNDWYENKIVTHGKFRSYLKKTKGVRIQKYSADMYSGLSTWTHHCYSTMKNSYSLGGRNGQMLVYDSHLKILILPQTISQYTWEIKELILYFLINVKMVGLINWKKYSTRYNRKLCMKGMSVSYVGSLNLTRTWRGPEGYAHEEDYRKTGRRSNDFGIAGGLGRNRPAGGAADAPGGLGA